MGWRVGWGGVEVFLMICARLFLVVAVVIVLLLGLLLRPLS